MTLRIILVVVLILALCYAILIKDMEKKKVPFNDLNEGDKLIRLASSDKFFTFEYQGIIYLGKFTPESVNTILSGINNSADLFIGSTDMYNEAIFQTIKYSDEIVFRSIDI